MPASQRQGRAIQRAWRKQWLRGASSGGGQGRRWLYAGVKRRRGMYAGKGSCADGAALRSKMEFCLESGMFVESWWS